jgi:hypothetical protein
MSEERSWAEETVELGAVDRRAPSEPEAAPPLRRRGGPGRAGAAAAIGLAGAAMIALVLIGGGSDGAKRAEAIKAEPRRGAGVERATTIAPRPSFDRPVRRRAGSLAIGLARQAPKPPRPKLPPAPAPAAPEEAATYEAPPEPVAEPAPAPEASPAPAPETPAAVEFGM